MDDDREPFELDQSFWALLFEFIVICVWTDTFATYLSPLDLDLRLKYCHRTRVKWLLIEYTLVVAIVDMRAFISTSVSAGCY